MKAFIPCIVFFILLSVMIAMPEISYADNGKSALGNTLCKASGWFSGNLGRAIAVTGVTIIGILALFGKVNWINAVLVGVGIAILFGADTILLKMGFLKNCVHYGF